ncbi:MAG: hypothetical protein U5L00_15720 [Desulfovermiculus sp.]|nr:hypothetical protein [Desulfovermiculus sp.]
MKLLIDTDAFCKLAVCGLLKEIVHLLGVSWSECCRLPALPYMLRRGRLRKKFGDEQCELMLPIAESIFPVPEPSDAWLEKLIPIVAIDPGEAQLFAAAAQFEIMVLTGDKRALAALKDIAGFPTAIKGCVITLEAALIFLCNHMGPDEIRDHLQPVMEKDQVIRICFSNPGSDPLKCLSSYYDDLAGGLAPLVLWSPWSGGL